MKLSELNTTPRYPITIPSTGKKTTFRPFLVREERALLTAQESGDISTMLATMESVARNCLDKPPEQFTTFDLEYVMTLIRAKSVGEYSDLVFYCASCDSPDAKTTVSVDLTSVQVSKNEQTFKVKLHDKLTAQLKYPSIQDAVAINDATDKEFELIKRCMDKLFTEDETFNLAEEPDSEIEDFVATLTPEQKKKIEYFVDNIPYTFIRVQYKCPVCGKEHDRELKGINSFF